MTKSPFHTPLVTAFLIPIGVFCNPPALSAGEGGSVSRFRCPLANPTCGAAMVVQPLGSGSGFAPICTPVARPFTSQTGGLVSQNPRSTAPNHPNIQRDISQTRRRDSGNTKGTYLRHLWPSLVQKHHLGVRKLPQQEVTQPLLTRRANQQVRIWQAAGRNGEEQSSARAYS
jgi:hypothetical protein